MPQSLARLHIHLIFSTKNRPIASAMCLIALMGACNASVRRVPEAPQRSTIAGAWVPTKGNLVKFSDDVHIKAVSPSEAASADYRVTIRNDGTFDWSRTQGMAAAGLNQLKFAGDEAVLLDGTHASVVWARYAPTFSSIIVRIESRAADAPQVLLLHSDAYLESANDRLVYRESRFKVDGHGECNWFLLRRENEAP